MTPDPIASDALASLTEGGIWALFSLAAVVVCQLYF